MKKEYYWMIAGLLVGGVAAFMIAKNKFQEPTSGFMVTDMGKRRRNRIYAECLEACNKLTGDAQTKCVEGCNSSIM